MKDGVAGELAVPPVDHFEPPQPDARTRMQPERDTMADAALFSFPDKAVIRSADAEPSLGTDDRQDRRLRPAEAQEKAAHAVGDRRGEHLVDHDPALRIDMLDGEDRAARQEADGDARRCWRSPRGQDRLCAASSGSLWTSSAFLPPLNGFRQSANASSLFNHFAVLSLSDWRTRRGRLTAFGAAFARSAGQPVFKVARELGDHSPGEISHQAWPPELGQRALEGVADRKLDAGGPRRLAGDDAIANFALHGRALAGVGARSQDSPGQVLPRRVRSRAAPRKTGEIGPNLTRMPPSTRSGAGSPSRPRRECNPRSRGCGQTPRTPPPGVGQ